MAASKPPARSAPPRYVEIAERLLADIRAGRYPAGTRLPTEVELCRQFKASRHTVREALRTITLKGLLSRRAGAGSTVIAAEQPAVFTQRLDSLVEWLSYPQQTRRENIDCREVAAGRVLAGLLKCEPDRRWFRISALRRVAQAEVPVAWTDIYVLPAFAAVTRRRDHERSAVFQQIEKQFGKVIERAQIEIFASRVPRKLARPLKVAAGTPALTVVRRYTDAGGVNFENTITIHPERRYTYSMELRRELRGLV